MKKNGKLWMIAIIGLLLMFSMKTNNPNQAMVCTMNEPQNIQEVIDKQSVIKVTQPITQLIKAQQGV